METTFARLYIYVCERHHHRARSIRAASLRSQMSLVPRSKDENFSFPSFRMHPLLNGNILVAISLYDFLFSPLCFKFNLFPLPIELDSMDRIIFELFLQAVERAIDTSVFSLFIVNGCAGSYPHTHTHIPLRKLLTDGVPLFPGNSAGGKKFYSRAGSTR